MAVDITLILLCIIFPVLTAISGLWKAKEKGEKIDWLIFIKTIVIGVVAAGLITQETADALIAISSTEIVTVALDWLFNAILNKTARTAVTA